MFAIPPESRGVDVNKVARLEIHVEVDVNKVPGCALACAALVAAGEGSDSEFVNLVPKGTCA